MTAGFDWLARAAARRPRHPALATSSETLGYAELAERSLRLAVGLAAAGVRPGGRVAVLMDACADFVALVHAVPAAGACLVPLGPRLAEPELAALLADARPALLVCDAANADAARRACALSGLPVEPLGPADLAPGPRFDPVEPAPGADRSILFTSGTTGRPRGARLSHAAQYASARASARRLGSHPADRWLLCLPPHHVGGLAAIQRCAIDAATLVLHERFDPERVARALAGGEASLVSLVPTMLERVLERRPGLRAPRLRAALVGGGPIPEGLVERCLSAGFPAAPTYGLTEAGSQVATLEPAALEAGRGTVGRALPGTRLRLTDADGRPVPPGEAGEIRVRGPQLMSGYLDRPDETRAALRDGWLRTGDFGRLDPAGRLQVLDRRDDLIVSGGENVYPREVEAALLAHPRVRDAAVVARPDPEWGQAPHAFVVCDDPAPSPAELRAWLRGRLAAFKLPRGFSQRPGLPRTPSGKLRRRRLREEIDGRRPDRERGPHGRAGDRP